MTSKKVLPVVLIIFFAGVFWAFRSMGKSDGDVLSKQQQLLATVGVILEEKHFNPKKIDDAFSKDIFKNYLDGLDNDKDLFLASDIQSLKRYETIIDDEIHGAPLKFFPAVLNIYPQRLNEAQEICKQILAQPFDFSVNESVQLDGDKLNYPANESERKEAWRKRLKYETLVRFVDLQNQRNKSTVDSIKNQTDAKLEQVARERELLAENRNFSRLQKTNTEDELFDEFVNTIANEMDPHTEYQPPIEKRGFDEDMAGRFYGIGAQLKQEDNGDIKIASLVTGSPAWKSGKIQVNDVIVKVANDSTKPVDVTGYAVTDAVKIIRGDKGTKVWLTLKKSDGTSQTISLIREEIVQDETYARSAVVTKNNKKIGYIFLPEFYADFEKPNGRRCSVDVANEIIKLKGENVDGIVLDLRNNGGGYLYEVVQMAGLFIKSGPIVQVKDREGKPAVLSDDDSSVLYSGPLAVMVNEFSASASEIFAAAIQDYKRGIIIGSTSTYGKGTVQKPIPLGKPLDFFSGATEYGALKLTFEKFYRINGGSTQLKGVTPDVVLPDVLEYLKFREKDSPTALGWDQIQKTDYTTWNSNINFNEIENGAEQRIRDDKAFTTIQNNTAILNKVDFKYDLNINKYKAEQALIRNAVQQDDSMLKLSKPLDVKYLVADKDKFYNNPDVAKGERYQQWLKSLQTDIYINETANIVSDMVNNYTANMVRH
ncbi:MAG: carboxy terminal-processing peptidase [Chitinophagaceae bacterium]